jgi:hypothetical protein
MVPEAQDPGFSMTKHMPTCPTTQVLLHAQLPGAYGDPTIDCSCEALGFSY